MKADSKAPDDLRLRGRTGLRITAPPAGRRPLKSRNRPEAGEQLRRPPSIRLLKHVTPP